MPKDEGLKYIKFDKGVRVSYNAPVIQNARKLSKTDKAHLLALEKQRKKKKLKQAITTIKVTAGMAVAVLAFGSFGFLYTNYINETSSVGMDIKYDYVNKLGPIMNDFSDEEIVDLASNNLDTITASNKPDAKSDVEKITAGLTRMLALKEQGKNQDARLVLKGILSILSDYGIFLPGYNFDKPDSFLGYAIDEIKDGIETIKAKTGN